MEPRLMNPRRGLTDDRGAALLLALVLTSLLAAAVAAAALTARAETLIAGHYARGLEALYMAEAGVALGVAELDRHPDWTGLLAAGDILSGPAAGWLGAGRIESQVTVTVRIADDPADNDGDPLADTNGVVVVHSSARGPTGARRAYRGVVQRRAPSGARLLSVQETR